MAHWGRCSLTGASVYLQVFGWMLKTILLEALHIDPDGIVHLHPMRLTLRCYLVGYGLQWRLWMSVTTLGQLYRGDNGY